MPTTTWLDISRDIVFGERAGSYGHPLPNFLRIALYWSIDLGFVVTPVQVAQMMISVKKARDLNIFKEDNYVDIIGYSETVERMDVLLKEMGYKEGVSVFRQDISQLWNLLHESIAYLQAKNENKN